MPDRPVEIRPAAVFDPLITDAWDVISQAIQTGDPELLTSARAVLDRLVDTAVSTGRFYGFAAAVEAMQAPAPATVTPLAR